MGALPPQVLRCGEQRVPDCRFLRDREQGALRPRAERVMYRGETLPLLSVSLSFVACHLG
jgi:hypothetical protein